MPARCARYDRKRGLGHHRCTVKSKSPQLGRYALAESSTENSDSSTAPPIVSFTKCLLRHIFEWSSLRDNKKMPSTTGTDYHLDKLCLARNFGGKKVATGVQLRQLTCSKTRLTEWNPNAPGTSALPPSHSMLTTTHEMSTSQTPLRWTWNIFWRAVAEIFETFIKGWGSIMIYKKDYMLEVRNYNKY